MSGICGVVDTTPGWQAKLNAAVDVNGEAAFALLQDALGLAGDEPEALQAVYQRLSRFGRSWGEREQALCAFENAGEQLQIRFGSCHPEWSLYLMLGAQIDPEGALGWLDRALQNIGRCKGRLHPDRVYLLARRATARLDQGDLAGWQEDLSEAEQVWVQRRSVRLDLGKDESRGLVQQALLQAARFGFRRFGTGTAGRADSALYLRV